MRSTRSRGMVLLGAVALLVALPGIASAQDAESVGNPYDAEGAVPGSGEVSGSA